MTVYEALILNRDMLGRLRQAGVRLDDIGYIDLFAEFRDMVEAGCKVTYAIHALSDKYGVSVRSIYSIVARMHKPLQL